MHPLSPWHSSPPDFKQLSQRVPAFAKHVKDGPNGTAHIDFHDAEAVRALTSALLLDQYGLHVDPPADRLCPPVPNRLNYILWLQDILASCWAPESIAEGKPTSLCPLEGGEGASGDAQPNEPDEGEERPTKRARREAANDEGERATPTPIKVLDIGTGAMAIYPLLGAASDRRWTFCGTDVDEASLQGARSIVSDTRNRDAVPGLAERVKLLLRRAEEPLIPVEAGAEEDDGPLFHLTMCNPPFYASLADMERSSESKSAPPNAVCSGSPGEMITDGGEVSFVSRMIRQSFELRERVSWYTTMLGLLSSVASVVEELKRNGVDNYSITEFQQGRTKRWAVAWSFTQYRLANDPCRSSKALHGVQPPSHERSRRIHLPSGFGRKRTSLVLEVMERELGRFGKVARESSRGGGNDDGDDEGADGGKGALHAWVGRDTWTRQARRARKRAEAAAAAGGLDGESVAPDPGPPANHPLLCVRCFLRPAPSAQPPSATATTATTAAASTTATTANPSTKMMEREAEIVTQWTYGPSSSLRLFESLSAAFFDALQRGLTMAMAGRGTETGMGTN